MTYATFWLVSRIVLAFHFRAYKFHCGKFASQMRLTFFTIHRKWWTGRTAWNAVLIYWIVSAIYRKLVFWRNKRLLKADFLKEGLIDGNRIKGCIPKKRLRFNKWMFLEKINQNWKQCLWIRKRFIFIRGTDFFSTTISGWAWRKSLL